jgi:hypothetical protein
MSTVEYGLAITLEGPAGKQNFLSTFFGRLGTNSKGLFYLLMIFALIIYLVLKELVLRSILRVISLICCCCPKMELVQVDEVWSDDIYKELDIEYLDGIYRKAK